ncbi:MAG TPA: site-specific integrase [Firmicutes bacterium]|nr:site-specific integrase [Candidatus Fermentithermobacillaceae bacterium]
MFAAALLSNPIDPQNFTRKWESLLQKAGLPRVRFHDARHTFATMLLEAGEDSKIVQELLGHSEISVTLDIYSHVGIGLKRAAVDRLSGFLSATES